MPGEAAKIFRDENYRSFGHQNFSYLSRGIYIEQLELWNDYFSKDSMLVLKSEDLFTNPRKVVEQTCEFLGVKKKTSSEFQIHNSLPYQDMEPETHKLLSEYFEPYNDRLYHLLGMNFEWEKSTH